MAKQNGVKPPAWFRKMAAQAGVAQSQATKEILGEGRTVDKLLEAFANACQWGEHSVNILRRGNSDAGVGLACKRGCSWCCHLDVTVTAPEVLVLARYLREHLSPEELAELKGKVAALGDQIRGMDAQARALSGKRCALLTNNECSAYLVRPLACRGWNSFDANRCEEATRTPGAKNPTDAVRLAIYQGTRDGLLAGLHEAGYHAETYELTAALRLVLETPDAEERWLRGERVFPREMVRDSVIRRLISLPVTA